MIEVEFEDGTSARWANLTDEQLDQVSEAVIKIAGQPDTILC